ncbi:pyridoxal phosphate biosynthesis protein [Caldimicrobium thiodismutans]|uniref:Pyridoxal phosphate homeostasis protein n=1 Tax=Caldimicrobium thiodismutans TaxID=1653476 RepID=A0A0U4W0M5_9BACT|nr:YggS family pyridoxal phosphate-dependent enzyme [Caldimicrobium thiodismutans]BAU22701.1 pyridoxal phosphate biosynthesis protein [Caldimicrobium thiodismutans]
MDISKEYYTTLKNNLEKVFERVENAVLRSKRRLEEVKILGASKKQSPEKIQVLYDLGIRLFGENYVQEAEKKISALEGLSIEWHLIGRLQTNKVKKALKLFNVLETIDRIELAVEIEKRLKDSEKKIPVFIEVNIGEEETKAGVGPKDLFKFCEELSQFSHLEVRGLMCLPPYEENPEKVRPFFARMRSLFEKVKPLFGPNFKELSMGTSHDFEVALEEGATLIRLGTILFGQRV